MKKKEEEEESKGKRRRSGRIQKIHEQQLMERYPSGVEVKWVVNSNSEK